MNTIQHVGFIGLGDQGAPMARAIAQKHMLHVWARRPASYEAMAGIGHFTAGSVEELLEAVDVLCVCLRSDDDLFQLMDDHQLAARLGGGKILINHGTGHPSNAKQFERLCDDFAVGFLDAPVSGGRAGAETRSLTTFVGGRRGAFVRSEDVIRCHSSSIAIMGPAGSGQFAKLCNNALTVSNLRNIVEVFALAEDVGLDLRTLQAALEHSSGGSFILQALGTKIPSGAAEHIAELNRADIREFADAMEAWGTDPKAVFEWAIKGPDGLSGLIDRLVAAPDRASFFPSDEAARRGPPPGERQHHSPS